MKQQSRLPSGKGRSWCKSTAIDADCGRQTLREHRLAHLLALIEREDAAGRPDRFRQFDGEEPGAGAEVRDVHPVLEAEATDHRGRIEPLDALRGFHPLPFVCIEDVRAVALLICHYSSLRYSTPVSTGTSPSSFASPSDEALSVNAVHCGSSPCAATAVIRECAHAVA